MKKTKRLICMLAVVCCLSMALSGCGGGNSKKTSSDGNVVISIVPQNDQPVDDDSRFVKEYERILGVDLEFVYLDRSKATELLNIRVASGEIPDIMSLRDDVFQSYLQQGALSGISEDKIKEKAPNMYELSKQNLGDNVWNFVKKDDKVYGFPNSNINGDYPYVPVWRDDWLRNVGIDKIPETLDEAEEAFYKFVNEDPDANGEKDTYALSDKGMSTVYGAFGGIPYEGSGGSNSFTWTVKDDDSVVATAVLPEMKDALTLLNKWYKDGLIDPEFITGENNGGYWANSVTFWNGRIGFSVPGMAYHVALPEGEAANTTFYNNFKEIRGEEDTYALGKPLVGPDGDSGTECWGVYEGKVVALGKYVAEDEAKVDKILEMYEKIHTDYDFNMYIRYGKADEDYDYDDVNGVVWKGDCADGETRSKLGLMTNGIYTFNNNFEFETAPKPMFYKRQRDNKHGDDYVDKIWGSLPSYTQYKATVDKMIKENYTLFITGARAIEEFDEFVQELNSAGLEQLTKEANEWYESTK